MHPVAYDLLITGATVLTADPARPIIHDAAIAISGNRLAFVGPAADLPAGATAHETRRLDGRVIAPGYVNVHTHAILSMVRGVAEDLGFAPAYTPGIPHGHDVRPDEAIALSRLGAMEAMLFGSTLINDSYVHADLTLGAMADLGLRVYACGRLHDVDFSGVADGRWEHHTSIGERTLDDALRLVDRWHDTADGRTGVQLAVHAPATAERPSWGELGEKSADGRLFEFLMPTPLTTVTDEISDAAVAEIFGMSLSPDAAAEAISDRVREHVTYMPGATGVRTNAQEAWEKGQGVCQDMAQLTVALMRAVGLPARYVSGYLHPQAKAEPGTTAVGQSHAWVEYWAGSWTPLDPTSGTAVGERHVVVARGRDYADVPPLKGIYHGASGGGMQVTVEVTRLA